MTCNVIVTADNGRFRAHVAELPDCKVEAESRDRALVLIQQRLKEIVQRSEIVQLEIPDLKNKSGKSERPEKQDEHALRQAKAAKPPKLVQFSPMVLAGDKSVHLETPWEYFGIFKDDPTWLPLLDEIEKQRDRHVVSPKKKKARKK